MPLATAAVRAVGWSNTLTEFLECVKRCKLCLYVGDKFLLKKDHQYFYQLQQQLFTTRKKYCDFVVSSVGNEKPADVVNERIHPESNHWKLAVPQLTQYWSY